jgi:hypothetical protein
MALPTLIRRKLTYALGSHHLAENVDTRWTAGVGGQTTGTLEDDEVIVPRLSKTMGYCAAALLATATTGNLDADTDMTDFTRTRLGYALGPAGLASAVDIEESLGNDA